MLCVVALLWANSAYAYLDPGTGSLIIQSLIAACAAGFFILKSYWYKIKMKFRRKDKKDPPKNSKNPDKPTKKQNKNPHSE